MPDTPWSLESYILHNEALRKADREAIERSQLELDKRYEQRFQSSEKARETEVVNRAEKDRELNDVRFKFIPRELFEEYKEQQAKTFDTHKVEQQKAFENYKAEKSKESRQLVITLILMGLTIVGLGLTLIGFVLRARGV